MAQATLLLLLTAALLHAQPARFGAPACSPSHQELADHAYFLLCHDPALKVSRWVAYELLPHHLNHPTNPRPSRFRPDPQLALPAALDSDYRHSGFSRGHLAPAADFAWSPDALRATFLLSYAVPKLQSVYAGVLSRLEAAVRSLAAHADAVYVFTGPIFEGELATIGEGRVAVPSHLFKAVLVVRNGTSRMLAAIVPNAPSPKAPLAHFLTTVDDIEARTRLDLFSALDDQEEQALEAARPRPL
ncbi:MAG: DNA/RNA non-specific endonuclease [Bryobacteraceae bacterium]|nr:DNA/RNA non-specific endonuclease [Bryobacteraceae bacterium]